MCMLVCLPPGKLTMTAALNMASLLESYLSGINDIPEALFSGCPFEDERLPDVWATF